MLTFALTVSAEDIASLLCSALEGGSNYWYMIESQEAPQALTVRTDPEEVFPHIDYPMNDGGSLLITTHEKDEHDGKTEWTLDKAALQRGLEFWYHVRSRILLRCAALQCTA